MGMCVAFQAQGQSASLVPKAASVACWRRVPELAQATPETGESNEPIRCD